MNELSTNQLFDLSHTIASALLEKAVYPWETIPKISEFTLELTKLLQDGEYYSTEEGIRIAKSATVAPSAVIRPPCIIGKGAEIRHSAFIRGGVIIGNNAVVGNSCEVKNSILFDMVQIPHFNYVGDSILGYGTHLGAGAVTSNVKSDKSFIFIKAGGKEIETGLKKLGAIIGDRTEIGCNSVLNPGTVIGKSCTVYPLSSVRGFIKENSIYKNSSLIVKKEEKGV